MSNLHNFGTTQTHKSQNGNNPAGWGPLVTIPAGNWKVSQGCLGPGSVQLQKSDGTVLVTGGQGRITFAVSTVVQFVLMSSNLNAVTGAGGTITEDDDTANYRGAGTPS